MPLKKSEQSKMKPSVEQMLNLQRIGVVVAKSQQKLKGSDNFDKAKLLMLREIDGYDFTEHDGRPYYWAHRFTGRVARKGFQKKGFQHWSMRIAESFWVQDEKTGVNDGHRTTYKFAWNEDQILTAEKNICASGSVMKEFYKGQEQSSNKRQNQKKKVDPLPSGLILSDGNGEVIYAHETLKNWGENIGVEIQPSEKPFPQEVNDAALSVGAVHYFDVEQLTERIEDFCFASKLIHFRSLGMLAALPGRGDVVLFEHAKV
jgi:hypothetical protein